MTANWSGPWCIVGDSNIIRYPNEKLGGCRFSTDMQVFSNWINTHDLMDLQLNGASFTRSNHQTDPVMSRLDRFLISGDWANLYPHSCQVALPKPTSDHCPIVLDSKVESWGPKPFHFELMCLEEKGFADLIQSLWSDFQIQGWAGYRLACKLNHLKDKIKDWAKTNFGSVEASMADSPSSIKEFDSEEEITPLR